MFGLRTKPSHQRLGLGLSCTGLGFCHVDPSSSRPRLLDCQYQPLDEDWTSNLIDWVRLQNWRGLACHLSLAVEDYTLLSTEAPEVPESELNQALAWSLRELLDAPPADFVIRSFPLAEGLERPGKQLCYAVAARRARLVSLVEAISLAGLHLASIDIPELALRNIASRLPEREQGLGLITSGSRGVTITLYRNDELYLTRPLTGISDLSGAATDASAVRLADQLSLEILRTLDYYDSQLGQRPLAALYLPPLPGESDTLRQALTANLPLPLATLSFAELVEGGASIDAEQQAHCLTALGAALRQDDTP